MADDDVEEEVSDTCSNVWCCKNLGQCMMTFGVSILLLVAIYWGVVKSMHPKFPIMLVAGGVLCVLGYVFYKMALKQKHEQAQRRESIWRQVPESAPDNNPTSQTAGPANMLDNPYRSPPPSAVPMPNAPPRQPTPLTDAPPSYDTVMSNSHLYKAPHQGTNMYS